MENKDIIKHLKEDIKISIVKDVGNTLAYHEQNKSGFHSIPRIIFCYIDYLGALVYGENKTENAVQYLDTYFDDEYKKVSSMLIEMWRHGTVHEYDPKVLTDGIIQLGWLTNISEKRENRAGHLKIYRSKKYPEKLSLKININQLTDDILTSVEKLITDIKNDAEKKKKIQTTYNNISSERHFDEIKNKKTRSIIKDQFNCCLKNISGSLDDYGNVLLKE